MIHPPQGHPQVQRLLLAEKVRRVELCQDFMSVAEVPRGLLVYYEWANAPLDQLLRGVLHVDQFETVRVNQHLIPTLNSSEWCPLLYCCAARS